MAAGKQFLKGLMDNPNFQKWFGDSVVRDAEGLPLEVYHGTVNDFTSFNPSFKAETHPKFNDSKQSIFLTSNPRLAQDYTGMVESDLSDEALKRFGLNRIDAPDGANIKSGYLSLTNPYQVDAAGDEYNRRKMINWIASARDKGHDGLIVKNLDDSMYKGSPDSADVYAIFSPTQFKSRFNAGTFDPTDPNFLKSAGLMTAGAGAAAYGMSPDDAEASTATNLEKALVRDAEASVKPKAWAKDAGSNTPNVAQAVAPSDPFSPSPSQLAATAALVAALKSKDQPLEDTYQPADFLTAFLTGGGGLASRSIQAALDPVFSAAMDYAPRVADAINPRNIILGLMR